MDKVSFDIDGYGKKQIQEALEAGNRFVIVRREHSKTGTRAYFDVYIIIDNELVLVTAYIAAYCELPYSRKREEIYLDGCQYSKESSIADSIAQTFGIKPVWQRI